MRNRSQTATIDREIRLYEGNMKIILIILGVVIVVFSILVFLFIRWANSPEQVAESQRWRKEQAAKKIEDEKNKAALEKEIEAKRANLKLVIDENFANNRFEFLDYKFSESSPFKFKDNQFHYSVFSTRGSNPINYFIFSKEDFEDFAAEMDFDIHGYDSRAGIFWDAQAGGDRNPTEYRVAYSSASGLDVEVGKDGESYDLGSFFESLTTQTLRVERFGKNLKVSVNGKILFDKVTENSGQGKVGIFLRNRGGNKDDSSSSINIDIKSFKVWK
jgi:hypothetical protein